MGSVYAELAKLTDAEAGRCLGYVVVRLASEGAREYATEEAAANEALGIAAAQLSVATDALPSIAEKRKYEAIRLILVEMVSLPDSKAHIRSWLGSDRGNTRGPISSALILAGIVLVLSFEGEFRCKKQNGKWTCEGWVRKSAAPRKILEKISRLL
jgi:hypothetical protein